MHCKLVLDLQTAASNAAVPLNHAQRRRPSILPSILRLPQVFKPSSAATPRQTIRQRNFCILSFPSFVRSTVFGKPRLQQSLFLFPLPTCLQYCIGFRLPSESFRCQWCCTRLKMNCISVSNFRLNSSPSSCTLRISFSFFTSRHRNASTFG